MKKQRNTADRAYTNIIVFFIFGPYLLISRFSYINIVETKYSVLMFSIIMLIMAAAFQWEQARTQCRMWIRDNKDVFWAMAVYAAALLLSFALSDNKAVAWFGSKGRYTGTLSMLLVMVSSFLIAVRFQYSRRFLDWFILFGLITAVWGILNFAGVDIFHMLSAIENGSSGLYVSGIGQKTFYAALLVMLSAIASVLYAFEESRKKSVIYFAASGVFYLAGFLSQTDNYFFALFFVFLLMPMWTFSGLRKARRTFNLAALMMLIAVSLDHIIPYTDDVHERFDMAARLLIRYGIAAPVLALCVLVSICLFCLEKKRTGRASENKAASKGSAFRIVRWVFPLLALLLSGGLISSIIYFTFVDKTTYLHHLEYFLRFNDVWGSNRGFAWKCSWGIFTHSYIYRRLLGYGADMTGEMMIFYFKDYAFAKGGLFDNAHNEYLQYLLTYGAVGLLSYLGMVVSVCRSVVKKAGADSAAIFLAVFAYLIQAVVSLNNIIVTPLMFMLLGVGLANDGNNILKKQV